MEKHFGSFHEIFAADGAPTTESADYASVKAAFLEQFWCKSNLEDIIAKALEVRLGHADLLVSLKETDKLYKKSEPR